MTGIFFFTAIFTVCAVPLRFLFSFRQHKQISAYSTSFAFLFFMQPLQYFSDTVSMLSALPVRMRYVSLCSSSHFPLCSSGEHGSTRWSLIYGYSLRSAITASPAYVSNPNAPPQKKSVIPFSVISASISFSSLSRTSVIFLWPVKQQFFMLSLQNKNGRILRFSPLFRTVFSHYTIHFRVIIFFKMFGFLFRWLEKSTNFFHLFSLLCTSAAAWPQFRQTMLSEKTIFQVSVYPYSCASFPLMNEHIC